MHPSPGVHNDTIARGMDFVMDEAAKRGLRSAFALCCVGRSATPLIRPFAPPHLLFPQSFG